MLPTSLPRSRPEALGLSSAAIADLIASVESQRLDIHSLMIVRHGQVAAEGWWFPYQRDDVHLLYSLSKSFTSTAIGMAVAEGRLSIEDPVLSFFPESAPAEVGENLRAMTVQHLLTMSTGQEADNLLALYEAPDGDWIRAFLARPVPYEPGTRFMYNSGATYALSAILTRLTGESVLDYLRPRLFDPLGIDKATWETDPKGISVGGWGLSVTTESIAKLGQLYLQKGVWEGRQLIPASWVEEATSFQIANEGGPESDWGQGYGYQFWRCRHNAYRGDGAFGQFCVVLADLDMVVAITASVGDMQAALNALWEVLLPSAKAEPLPDDPDGNFRLSLCLEELAVFEPDGMETTQLAASVSGRAYRNDAGETLECLFAEQSTLVILTDPQGEHRLEAGALRWVNGQTDLLEGPMRKVAAAGSWVSEDTFQIEARFIESPEVATLILRFDQDEATLQTTSRGRFGPPEGRAFTGHLVTADRTT